MILHNGSNLLSDVQSLTFLVQRRLNPEDKWQNLPSYLPRSWERSLVAYRVSDKNDASSILPSNNTLICTMTYLPNGNSGYTYRIDTYRFMQENPGGFKNRQRTFWDKTDIYYTVKAQKPYYGEEFQWNGVCLLAPYQAGPTLKSLKLKGMTNESVPSFLSAEGEFDFSGIDFKQIYKRATVRTVQQNGMDLVLPEAYSEQEARKLELVYIRFSFSSTVGVQVASSSGNKSSAENPGFKVLSPFLNSKVSVEQVLSSAFFGFQQGILKKGKEENTFVIKPYESSYKFSEVKVVYEK